MNKPGRAGGRPQWDSRRRLLIGVLLIGSVVNYLDRVNLSIAAVDIRAEFALDPVAMGTLLSAFMWPYALANLPAGWLVDRWGWNRLFVWSLLSWSLATLAGGLAGSYASLYLSRVVLGIAEAPFFIIGGKVARLYFSPAERGLAASWLNVGPKMANAFAPPLLAAMMIWLGWRGMFIGLGAAGLVLLAGWLAVRPRVEPRLTEVGVWPADTVPAGHSPGNFLYWFRQPAIIWFNLGNIGTSYVFWLYFTWLPTYLIDERHLSLQQAGWMTAWPFVAGIAAVPLGGWLSDRLIGRGVPAVQARLWPAVAGSLLAGVVIMPANFVDSLWGAELLIALSTFLVSARVGVLWALVGDLVPPPAVGLVGGIQNFANFLGGALAPLATGWLLANFAGGYSLVFIVSGAICLAGSLSYAMIRHPVPLPGTRPG
ncbi:MAG: MFS transporter [Negativicutes bacterium]|nr:MFS transporter [Negativicutes bacterium]